MSPENGRLEKVILELEQKRKDFAAKVHLEKLLILKLEETDSEIHEEDALTTKDVCTSVDGSGEPIYSNDRLRGVEITSRLSTKESFLKALKKRNRLKRKLLNLLHEEQDLNAEIKTRESIISVISLK